MLLNGATTAPAPTAHGNNRSTFAERYVRWWLDDYPPLDGRLRFVFYFGLLFLSTQHGKSFVGRGSILGYERTDPELYYTHGLMGLLQVPYVDPDRVRVLMTVTKVAWVLAGVGLFSRFSSAVTAGGALCLHGIFFHSNAKNRTWFVPAYCLVALCFTSSDAWSADHCLRNFLGWKAKPRSCRSVSETGFARKCILVMVVGFYFASGLGKLYASGFRWADGHSLQYYAGSRDEVFTWMLTDHLWFSTVCSAASLFFEFGSVLMLVSWKLRLVFLVGLSLMHVGIRYTVNPWYFSNIWCFVLLVDWCIVARWVRTTWLGCRLSATLAHRRPHENLLEEVAALGSELPRPPLEIGSAKGAVKRSSANAAAAGGTCLLALMTFVAVFHIEWWPFTNVDLYSGYYKGEIAASYPRSCYSDVKCVQRMSRAFKATKINEAAQMRVAGNVVLQLVNFEKKKVQTFEDGIGVPNHKRWNKSCLTPVVTEDFASKPEGKIEWDAKNPDNPASLFLRRILPSIRRNVRKWKDFDYAVLTYHVKGSGVTIAIAKVPLRDDSHWSSSGTSAKIKYTNRTELGGSSLIVAQAILLFVGLFIYLMRVKIRAVVWNCVIPKDSKICETSTLDETVPIVL